jgi:DNA repair protein RadD
MLRPYQEHGLSLIKQAWRDGHKSIVVVAPGGAGKTALAEEMTARSFAHDHIVTDPAKQFDVWFLAHRQELIDQPLRRYAKRGMRAGVVKAGVKPNPLARLQIASIQTLANRVVVPTLRKKALVFIDEAHRAKATQYLEIIANLKQTYSEVYFILLTATPYRGDHQGLSDVATKLIEITTPRQLIQEGWIVNPTNYIDEDTRDLQPGEDADRPKLVANIVEYWKKYSGGCPGIGFAINVAHSRHLVERFQTAGLRAAHLDGETPKEERRRLLARLAIGGQESTHPEALDVLCNVDVLTEGFDSESSYDLVLEDKTLWLGKSYPPEYQPLSVIGDWAPTKSMGKYIQRAVRNCRIHPKKKQAIYLDHSGNIRRHCRLVQHEGFTLDDGSAAVAKKLIPVAPRYVMLECPRCHIGLPKEATRCPDCGCESLVQTVGKGGPVIEEAPGKLVQDSAEALGVRKQLPHEQLAELRARMNAWLVDNERRLAEGKAPFKWGWVLKQYETNFRQVVDGKVVGRIRKEFGV